MPTAAHRLARARALESMVRDIARAEILPRYLKSARNRKADGSLFTEADMASQQRFSEALPAFLPGAVLGEEMTAAEQAALWREGARGLWCIDPIDGTTNFANGIPLFAVSIAYLIEHEPVIGVVYNPITDESFYAARGAGAFLNGAELPLRPRAPPSCATPSPASTSSASATTSATSSRCARPTTRSATSAPARSNGASSPPAGSTSTCTAGRCCGTTPPAA
jgi:fructose-1,6-bisphosphatase/inositol monophosphatase family enzyme